MTDRIVFFNIEIFLLSKLRVSLTEGLAQHKGKNSVIINRLDEHYPCGDIRTIYYTIKDKRILMKYNSPML